MTHFRIAAWAFIGGAAIPPGIGLAAEQEAARPSDASPAEPPKQVEETRPIDGIRDNSFLVEEAYNQEAGVVQHTWTARFGADHRGAPSTRSTDLSFTQEWPLWGQAHQLSYTLPYAFVDEDGEHASGIGDLLIHYRHQLLRDVGRRPAFSPRVSLILPSGDEDRGFGTGEAGVQMNLPFSKTLSDRVYVNLNAGLTYQADATFKLSDDRRSRGLDLLSFNLGASLIYAVTDTFHVLLEAAWDSTEGLEEVSRRGQRRPLADRNRGEAVVLSPGIRWAWNVPGDLQIVPGVAVPIGLTEDAIDYGVFLYLSIEHPFVRGDN